MTSIDHAIAGLGGHGAAIAVVLAVLLGLRHATDPDHLTVVSMLVMADAEHGTRRAGRLGLSWGTGHAITLILFGLPVVVLGIALPAAVEQAAEVTIGAVIFALAIRLLVR